MAKIIKTLGIVTLIAGGVPTWNYLQNHNSYTDTDSTLVLRKMDGWIAHSQVEISYSRKDLIFSYTDPLGEGSRKYSDAGRDGVLDLVVIDFPLFQTSGVKGSFSLKNDAENHPKVFAKENELYQQQVREFQENFPEQWKRMGLDELVK